MIERMYVKPPNTQKLEKIDAFCSEDEKGNRGLIAKLVGGTWMTFVTGEKRVADMLKQEAILIGKDTGNKILLVTYTVEESERLH